MQLTPISQLIRRLTSLALPAACVVAQAFASAGPSLAQVPRLPPFHTDTSLPNDITVNANQGLGQAHWLDTEIMSQPGVSWGYDAGATASGWATIEPEPGLFNWAPLDKEIGRAKGLGKRIWIQLLTTEGQTPQWAIDAGVPIIGSRGGAPVPWNDTYLRLLRRAVHAMAARYDKDPTVDAVNIMAGGTYGEMSLPHKDARPWEAAGYTDERFVETVKKIIDIYLEDEFTWEDGTKTHGFQHTPVVLQVGSGLYGHTAAVIQPVVDYAMATYGMRVWLKYNGFGSGYDMGWLFEQYSGITRVGYEPGGNSEEFLNKPVQFMRTAVAQHSSYLCLQSPYFRNTDARWQEARDYLARYLGAQIIFRGHDFPNTVSAGADYPITFQWVNRGTVPLIRPQRQDRRDVPASYDVLVALFDPASGATVLEQRFTPQPATTEWYSAEAIEHEIRFRIPEDLPAGNYEIHIALENPGAETRGEARYHRLTNSELVEHDGRYVIGTTTVMNSFTATATPTTSPPVETATPVAPTPMPTATSPAPGGASETNWLVRLLQSVWNWVIRLLP